MGTDSLFMQRALDLAAQGSGFTHPNPMVGAVLVYQGRILAEGYHHRAGEPHAEIMALRNLSDSDRELLPMATMYVTLEPCSHHGRTGPCSQALIDHNVGRVVVALEDPNPLVSGRGIAMLRAAGTTVDVGLAADQAEYLNRAFLGSIRQGRPWVTLKWASDANGAVDGPRSATHPGPWSITGPEAQLWSHRLRQTCGALLIGAGTWLSDHTSGTVRAVYGTEIQRIMWASRRLTEEHARRAQEEGWTLWSPEPNEDPAAALIRHLASCGLRSLMVEGGPATLQAFIHTQVWNEAFRWSAPISLPEGGPREPLAPFAWRSLGRYGADELLTATPIPR